YVIEQRIERTAAALKANNMDVYVAESREDVATIVKSLLSEGDVIGVGGSETLNECGIIPLIRSEKYNFIDRYAPGLTREEMHKLHIQAIGADTYISGTNAITEDGALYNVDGNANRIAAIAFGPKSVIIVAGYNKIVKTLDDAIKRVKSISAPANTKRLSCPSYCEKAGQCLALAEGSDVMTDGCNGDGRICCDYLVSARQRIKGRIKVILVKEELGF
ncbi:MAG: lactate utilization protein, partial [Clostridia bacterium]|nr:lactate utilization protein [Clostridia bacterium]